MGRQIRRWGLVSSNLNSSVGTLFYAVPTNRYLFLLRNTRNHNNTWGFCSGKVEKNESYIEAMEREIVEELGFMPNVSKHIPVETFTNTHKNFIFQTYVSIVDNEFIPKLNNENSGYAWTSIEQYPKPLHPGVFNALNVDEIMSKFKTLESIWFSKNT